MSRGFLEDDGPRKSDLVDLTVVVIVDRPLAWLVMHGSHRGWVPKSVGELDGKILTLPRSFAEEKGLV